MIEAPLVHSFNHFVNGSNRINVTCTKGKRSDGLPDWVWSEENYEFIGFMPKCFDPTYCLKDPPIPRFENADYKIPSPGTLRYKDGEVVTYKCTNFDGKCPAILSHYL